MRIVFGAEQTLKTWRLAAGVSFWHAVEMKRRQ